MDKSVPMLLIRMMQLHLVKYYARVYYLILTHSAF